MPTMIVKLKVTDFDRWKSEYDLLEMLRREHSWNEEITSQLS